MEKVENGWGHGKMKGKWNKTEHEWEIRGTGNMLWERAIACLKNEGNIKGAWNMKVIQPKMKGDVQNPNLYSRTSSTFTGDVTVPY